MDSNAKQEGEVRLLRDAYAAFNRGDIRATVSGLDPEIEWIEPAEFPGGGTYHGHAGVAAYLTQSRAGWAEGASEPERFLIGEDKAEDKVVVFVHVRARPKGNSAWSETRLADVFTFRNGRPVQMRAFADRRQALDWAGIQDTEAPGVDITPKKATIARIWKGRARRERADEYQKYNYEFGIKPLMEKAMGVQALREDRESETEFMTISYWESVDAMSRFTGGDPTRIHHLERDHEFLIEMPTRVQILSIYESHLPASG